MYAEAPMDRRGAMLESHEERIERLTTLWEVVCGERERIS
jgi:hypothetical protein